MSYLKLSADDCYNLFTDKNPKPSEKFLDAEWDGYVGLTPARNDWLDPEYREGYTNYCSIQQLEYLNQKYNID